MKNEKVTNILIVGVGGQGSLLASRIIGALYINRNIEVKISEVHGMSQRGGSVVTHVRAGDGVASPIVAPGEADILISFEELESLRWAHYLRKGGSAAVSTQTIPPASVLSGAVAYPEGIVDELKTRGIRLAAFDALAAAVSAGTAKAANVALLGAASVFFDFTEEEWLKALSECVKPKFLELNIAAFKAGEAAAKEAVK